MLASLLDAFSFHLFGPPTFTQKDLDALIEEVAALDRSEASLKAKGPPDDQDARQDSENSPRATLRVHRELLTLGATPPAVPAARGHLTGSPSVIG